MTKNKTSQRGMIKDWLMIITLALVDFLLIIFTLALMGVGGQ